MKTAPANALLPFSAPRSVVIGTAGHVDHGKTALVLALTGTDTDRFPEEKARGITIDLGFASLTLAGHDGQTVDLSLIDVPGHQAFIHNMLAGAGGIDAVLLVVAANEGVKAQTTEHLAICSLLGVRSGVIALTKSDAVSAERLQEIRGEVSLLVGGTFLENAPVISVSAYTGQGMDELRQTLVEVSARIPEHSADAVLRLPLDRAFSVPGFGTVVTGTLRDGSLRPGDTVEIQPGGRVVRVRGVQVHHRAVKQANAPTRAALNIAALEVSDVRRGDVILEPGTLVPTHTVDVELTALSGTRGLRHRSQVGIHAFTSEASARVLLYDNDTKIGDKRQLARLRLGKPMLLAPGDRFVLRQRSPAKILGGGRVLDAKPLPRKRKVAVREWLEEVREASPERQIYARVRRRGMQGVTLAELVQETGIHAEAVSKLTAALVGKRELASAGSGLSLRFVEAGAVDEAAERLFKELTRQDSRSSTRAQLVSRTRVPEWVLEFAVQRLVHTKSVQVNGTQISLSTPNPAVVGHAQLLDKVEALYRKAGLASPIIAEAASVLQMQPQSLIPLITALIRSGKLIRMGSDTLLIHVDAIAHLRAELAGQRGQNFDVGRFKLLTGLTRKHAIPLLEYLDRERLTVNRQGIRTVL